MYTSVFPLYQSVTEDWTYTATKKNTEPWLIFSSHLIPPTPITSSRLRTAYGVSGRMVVRSRGMWRSFDLSLVRWASRMLPLMLVFWWVWMKILFAIANLHIPWGLSLQLLLFQVHITSSLSCIIVLTCCLSINVILRIPLCSPCFIP